MFSVEEAIALARKAHTGQTDKAGHPYIDHPLRVMHRLGGEHEQMAAILHDVLEDTPTTVEDLRTVGCPEPVIAAVRALTKHPGEPLDAATAQRLRHKYAHSTRLLDRYAKAAPGSTDGR
jgi:(p)ppGpp synthase/HD superfamily hydrolase